MTYRLETEQRGLRKETRRSGSVLVVGSLLCVCFILGCAPADPAKPALDATNTVDIDYVGDEACASCHGGLYDAYHQTGMGKSVTRFDEATAPEQFGETSVRDARSGYEYQAFVRGDTLFQREYRVDESGNVVYEQEYPAEWVIGSGHATRSYLMNVNGYITQMPLTWYVDRQKWDMSPGYEQTNQRFSRPINLECMACHNAAPAQSVGTQNHYTQVPLGISCERCHGPGGAHVDARLDGYEPPEGENDPYIVNPANLTRNLQLSVCQQCHLTGTTVFQPGEDMTTYMPGEPLVAHRTVFVTEEQFNDPSQFGIASHASRLALSACYIESEMTCTTCHDPHFSVNALSDDYFNERCQSCHGGHADEDDPMLCVRPDVTTQAEAMTGNCVSCHLQKSGTSDIPHVTFTDHWIRRTLPEGQDPDAIERIQIRDEPFTLVRVESELPETNDGYAQLEEAIAYFQFYETQHRLPDYLPLVTEQAQQGLAKGADHPEARLALARAQAGQGQRRAAIQTLEAAVAEYPGEAMLQYWLGVYVADEGRTEQAVSILTEVIQLQPALVEAQFKQAEALNRLGRLDEAESVYRAAFAQDPIHHPDQWNNFGFMLFQANRLDEAVAVLDRSLALQPNSATALVNRGTVALTQQDLDGAQGFFEKAIAADPNFVAAYANLGLVYGQQGQLQQARSMFERVIALEPNDQRARAMLSQINELIRTGE